MKILILTNSDEGLLLFRKELIEMLLERGDKVFISCPQGEAVITLMSMGCTVFNTFIERRRVNVFKDLKLYKGYKKLLKNEKPDIVLTYTIKPNIYGGLACKKFNIPYVANITGLGTAIENPGLLRKLLLLLLRISLKKATKIFFQNEANKSFLISHKVVQSQYEVLAGSGVNIKTNNFENYPDNDEALTFITIGRIMKDKGADELLAAAKIIKGKYDNVNFKLAGCFDENYEKKIRLAVENGTIEYLGYRNDVHNLIKNAHATIHPSYHEGMSNVLLESAACGRPVIASDVPGCRETFDDGVSGISFKSKSVDSLVSAVEKFIKLSLEEKKQMGLAGRKKIEREFNRQNVVDAYLSEIKKIEDNNETL